MDINPSADRSSSPAPRPTLLVLVDIAISSAWLFFPNLLMGMGAARVMFMANKSLPHPWNEDWLALCATFDATTYLLIGGATLILVIMWLTARRFLILPL